MVGRVGPLSKSWRTFLRNHVRQLISSEILPRSSSGFRVHLTRVTFAIKRWLTAKSFKQLRYRATAARDIEDERIRDQAVLRPRNQTVVALIDFASRGPPGVRPLFNNLSLPRMPATALCPVTSGSTSRVRWRKVTKTFNRRCHASNSEHKERQTLPMYLFPYRSDRLAA